MANLLAGQDGRELFAGPGPDANLLEVWLVDDDADFRGPLKKLLNLEPGLNCSHDFSSAPAAFAALQMLAPPDAILLDIQMPGMTGIKALPRIQQLAPSTAVLMLSTFFDPQRRQLALAAGADNFLTKFQPMHNLVSALRVAKINRQNAAGAPRPPRFNGTGKIQKFFSRFLP